MCICESRDNFVIRGVRDSRRIHKKRKRNAQTECDTRRHTQPYMRSRRRGAPQEIYACRRHRKEDSEMRDPDVTSLIEYMSSMGSVFMQVAFLSQIRVLQYCSSQVWLWTSFDIHNMCTLPRSCEERTSTRSADDK